LYSVCELCAPLRLAGTMGPCGTPLALLSSSFVLWFWMDRKQLQQAGTPMMQGLAAKLRDSSSASDDYPEIRELKAELANMLSPLESQKLECFPDRNVCNLRAKQRWCDALGTCINHDVACMTWNQYFEDTCMIFPEQVQMAVLWVRDKTCNLLEQARSQFRAPLNSFLERFPEHRVSLSGRDPLIVCVLLAALVHLVLWQAYGICRLVARFIHVVYCALCRVAGGVGTGHGWVGTLGEKPKVVAEISTEPDASAEICEANTSKTMRSARSEHVRTKSSASGVK